MSNNSISKLLSPGDLLPILVIIAGLLLIITIDEPAIQIIGLALSVLSGIGLFVQINQRKKEIIDNKFKQNVPPPNFKVTVQESQDSKKTTFDNFQESINEEEKKSFLSDDFNNQEISSDEGFRIIKKGEVDLRKKSENSDELVSEEETITDIDNQDKSENSQDNSELENQNDDPRPIELPIENLMDKAPSKDDGPRKEFEFCVTRILISIRSINNTCSTAFFIFNPETKELRLESFATSVQEKIVKNHKFKLGNDVLSSIIEKGRPEIVSNINPSSEKELIPYYLEEIGISSFVGVPVIYNDMILGVLCADSIEEDAFDSVMISFLGQYNKLISTLLSSYSEKYDLIEAYKGFNIIKEFGLDSDSEQDIINGLVKTVNSNIDFDYFSLISYDDEMSAWFSSSDTNNIDNNNFDEKLFKSDSFFVKSIENKNIESGLILDTIREKWFPEWAKYFWNIPIFTESISFGSILLFFKDQPDNQEQLSTLSILANLAAISLEKIQLGQILNQGSIIDFDTGLMNYKVFKKYLESEFNRAKENKRQLALCLFNIDEYTSFKGENESRLQIIVNKVVSILNNNKRSYDQLGVFEENIFGIILPEMNSDNVKIWAEKLRSEIATTIIEIDNHRLNTTISLGVSNIKNSDDIDEFISNAKKALLISQEKTNQVSLFG